MDGDKKTKNPGKTAGKIAVIRIRGQVDVRKPIKDTLDMLGLRKPNWATVVDDTQTYRGMIRKVKDFVTWGEIDEATFTAIVAKWGRKAGGARLDDKDTMDFPKAFMSGEKTFREASIKPYFRLHAPSRGHRRVGIKKPYSIGGVLGYRGGEINKLISRMAGLREVSGKKPTRDGQGKSSKDGSKE